MLDLQKKYHDARMESDKELYERQIRIVDKQIDRRVYDLYGLTEDEIKVVGGGEILMCSMLFYIHAWIIFLSCCGISFSGE